MSLILDALRKSERTRQQSLSGRLGAGETPSGRTHLPVPWMTLLGVLLAINAVVIGFLLLRPSPSAPAVAPVAAPAPDSAAQQYHPAVRPLADEAGVPADAPAAAAPVAENPTPAANPAPAPTVANDVGTLPDFDGLPADLRQAIPNLHLDVHGYAPVATDRFVVINLQRYRIGDTLAEGPKLVDIVPQGAVLEFRGTRFLLPAS